MVVPGYSGGASSTPSGRSGAELDTVSPCPRRRASTPAGATCTRTGSALRPRGGRAVVASRRRRRDLDRLLVRGQFGSRPVAFVGRRGHAGLLRRLHGDQGRAQGPDSDEGERGTEQRRDDEEPHVREGGTAGEQGRPERAGRVH